VPGLFFVDMKPWHLLGPTNKPDTFLLV